ncbi:MAG: GNAT family N-acetyltransferase [Dysgonomonas sp.]|nr:GNAT family N-acetyltransferase [Dysgonomonas sp.]
MDYNVVHNEKESRFETEVEGLLSLVDYIKKEGVVLVTHTEVPRKLEGRGIAAALTKTLLEYVRDNNFKVRPICSYTKGYLARNLQYKDIIG